MDVMSGVFGDFLIFSRDVFHAFCVKLACPLSTFFNFEVWNGKEIEAVIRL